MKNDLISISLGLGSKPANFEEVKVRIVMKTIKESQESSSICGELKYLGCPVKKEGIFMPFMTRKALRTCCPQIAAFLHIFSTNRRAETEGRRPESRNEMQKISSQPIKPGLFEAMSGMLLAFSLAVGWKAQPQLSLASAQRNRKRKISGPIRTYGHMDPE